MKKITIAVDGYSSCGKSTIARALAKKLHYTFIDSGAMYRAVALYFLRNHIHYKIAERDVTEIEQALDRIRIEFRYNEQLQKQETYLNGENVEDEIRQMFLAEQASKVSTIPAVRRRMVAQQKVWGNEKGLVMDGRDIGTVVFPEAELKLFLTADPLVRARRRQNELEEKGYFLELDEVLEKLKERDHLDSTREDSPLRKADDAIIIDNSYLTPEEQFEEAWRLACQALEEANGANGVS